MRETTRAILERAGEIITEKGWTQGCYEDKDGSVCVSQALTLASKQVAGPIYLEELTRARRRVIHAVRPHLTLPGYNDVKARSVEDVLLALKRAAEED